jgi:iron complex transport system substrate-binding protein
LNSNGGTRICSLLPSATEIVAELGLADSLVAVSEECKWPAEVQSKPRVTAARVDSANLSSAEIDRVVRDSVEDGRPLYTVDAALIDDLQPDLLITQDLCTVCAVSSNDLATACPVGAEVISLDPGTLAEVAGTVTLLAERLGAVERGRAIVAEMNAKLDEVRRAVQGLPRPRVFVAEWIDPPFCAGHWVPEMVELAGGEEVLGVSAQPSFSTTWERVLELEPELIVIAPCGFDADQAAERAAGLELPGRVVAVDADSYYSRPAPRLADGIRQLAHLLHPDAVPDPGLPAVELQRLRR